MKNKTFIFTLAAIVLAGSGTYFLVQQYLVSEDMVESEIEEESVAEEITNANLEDEEEKDPQTGALGGENNW